MIEQFKQPDFIYHILGGVFVYFLWFFGIKIFGWLKYYSRKQLSFLFTLGCWILYELSELIWNMGSYSGYDHWFLDSSVDMIAVLIGVTVTSIILIGVKK